MHGEHGDRAELRVFGCRWLVEKGCDVDAATADGTVALHYAVWQGHMHVAKWLVYEAGCCLAHCNSFGCKCVSCCL
jgi:hypothetical protein